MFVSPRAPSEVPTSRMTSPLQMLACTMLDQSAMSWVCGQSCRNCCLSSNSRLSLMEHRRGVWPADVHADPACDLGLGLLINPSPSVVVLQGLSKQSWAMATSLKNMDPPMQSPPWPAGFPRSNASPQVFPQGSTLDRPGRQANRRELPEQEPRYETRDPPYPTGEQTGALNSPCLWPILFLRGLQ